MCLQFINCTPACCHYTLIISLPRLQLCVHQAMTYLLLIDLLDTYSSSVHVLQAFVPCVMHTSSSYLQNVRSDHPSLQSVRSDYPSSQNVRSDYPRPPTYLPLTVFNIICCCFIWGIFAKRYGAKVGTSRNIR